MTQKEQNNYETLLNKKVNIILTLTNGKIITYNGLLQKVDEDSLLLNDRFIGTILIRKKDISQIIPNKEEVNND